jgi:hypothetical protein
MTVNLALNVERTNNTLFYSAAIEPLTFPSSPGASFSTGVIASADHQYLANTVGNSGWSLQEPSFSSFDDLVASLQQSWTIALDTGLATERNYTMTVNLGSLLSMDLTPPAISFPISGSLITTLSPTFLFTTPSQYSFLGTLQKLQSSGFDATTNLPGGSTTWTPSVLLEPEATYVLDIYNGNITVPGWGFATPIDSTNNPLSGWASGNDVILEAGALFSAVPEPSAFVLCFIGLTFLITPLAVRFKASRQILR